MQQDLRPFDRCLQDIHPAGEWQYEGQGSDEYGRANRLPKGFLIFHNSCDTFL
jgi:hypothetical protein